MGSNFFFLSLFAYEMVYLSFDCLIVFIDSSLICLV